MKTLVLAGGCFWGVEAYLKLIEGVTFTEVGYANGPTIEPTYEEVCQGVGHTEAVSIMYDTHIITTKKLVDLFMEIIDPFALNQQGNDKGVQYRTGIYYQTNDDASFLEKYMDQLEQETKQKVRVEILPLENFYRAEAYHQNYLDKNPGGYCHIPKSYLEKPIKA